MPGYDDQDGFGEGLQRGFALDDAVSFTRLLLELYGYRCAVSGRQFAALTEVPHPDLDVYLFQPLSEGGTLAFGNAIVVERAVSRLLDQGQIAITDDFVAIRADGSGGAPVFRPPDRAFWPSPEALEYHRRHKGLGTDGR
jgi:predicted restriction endonuclease